MEQHGIKCPRCKGSGKCITCEGTMHITTDKGGWRLCPTCGSRRTPKRRGMCLRCWGEGWVAESIERERLSA